MKFRDSKKETFMKRYLLSLLLAVTMATPLLAADSIDSVFDDFSKVDNADYVNVRPFMMKLCGLVGACQGDLDARIIRKVRSVKVLDLDCASQADKTRLRGTHQRHRRKGAREDLRSDEERPHQQTDHLYPRSCRHRLHPHQPRRQVHQGRSQQPRQKLIGRLK